MARFYRNFCLFISVLTVITACGGGGGGGGGATTPIITNFTLSWNANHETAVNTSGGGYKIYYSIVPGFNSTDPGVTIIDVPYVSGNLSPTSTTVQLSTGTYYFRVAAYSELNSPWSSGGTVSSPSGQITIVAP